MTVHEVPEESAAAPVRTPIRASSTATPQVVEVRRSPSRHSVANPDQYQRVNYFQTLNSRASAP